MNPLTPWLDPENSIEKTRRELERLLGYPKGAFDPGSTFLRDMERINKVLGEGFVLLEHVLNPEQLRRRVEALHLEEAVSRTQEAIRQVFELPRTIWEIKPPSGDRLWRR